MRRRVRREGLVLHIHRATGVQAIGEADLERLLAHMPARGRPPGTAETDAHVRACVLRLHDSGRGYTEIARQLNEERVPTARRGRQWWPSTVRALCARPCTS